MKKIVEYCSFCGKAKNEVKNLIRGPSVYICNECISLCNDIVNETDQINVIKSCDPLAANLLQFLDDCIGVVVSKPICIADSLLAERLDTNTNDLHKSINYLKKKKKITVIPVSDEMNIYTINGKSISAEHADEQNFYSFSVNILVRPNPKLKLLP